MTELASHMTELASHMTELASHMFLCTSVQLVVMTYVLLCSSDEGAVLAAAP